MINQRNIKLIVICWLTLYTNTILAQQPKVDSAIMYLNKSFATSKLDSASFEQVYTQLNAVSLTDSQIAQIETALKGYKSWENKEVWHYVRIYIFYKLSKSDINKAINYGKQQIEQLDKVNTPGASTIKSYYLEGLRFPFRNSNRLEDGFQYYTKKLNEYKTKNDSIGIEECHFVLGGFYRISGLLDLAIYNMKKSISYIDSTKNIARWVNNIGVLGNYYFLKGNAEECIKYNRMTNDYNLRNGIPYTVPSVWMAQAMLLKNQLDSAAIFLALAKNDSFSREPGNWALILQAEAELKIQSGAFVEADSLLQQCRQLILKNNIPVNGSSGTIAPDYYFAQLCIKQGSLQEAIDFLQRDISRLLNNRVEILRDYKLIAELYAKMSNGAKAAEAYAIFIAKQDSLQADQEKFRSISFEAEQQMNEKELSIATLESQNRIASLSRNFLMGIAALLLLGALGIYQRFRFKKKANAVLEITLTELKSTQSQLIQSEKMASLGELTAGIAHEIQNPLNFVNNFSEVNKELADELEQEIDKGNYADAKAIAKDIKENEEKINHHGKRADAIVKGMLQHSSSGSGVKEPTEINALADEYLRLAYHGLRAKDKNFNATIKTEFDERIGNINIIPQDMGKVFLNLINNAFYAVNERSKEAVKGYVPEVMISTRLLNATENSSIRQSANSIIISVKDNGNGIPQKILDKIFQPFFTTKPTGQGTGLGLSLSYDIIKAHQGKISIKNTPGSGAEFVITLPINA